MTKEVFDPIHTGLTEALAVSKGWDFEITAAPRGEEKITTMTVVERMASELFEETGNIDWVDAGPEEKDLFLEYAAIAIRELPGMYWNFDLDSAPRDGTHVILAMPKNKTLRSYWCKPKNDPEHWCMLSHKDEPLAWMPWPEHPFPESPRKAAEAVAERPASSGATVASGLVEADKAEAVAGGLGQPELIPALTVQHGGVNVDGPERAGVTGGESAATSFQVSNRAKGESGANASKGVTAGETATQFYLEDVGGGA